SLENIAELESRGSDVYLPDSNLARELNTGQRCPRVRLGKIQRRMRQKLRGPTGQAVYRRRKALVEPVWGTLKEQRGMRRFRLRGLEKVRIEFTLAAISFNLTRLLASRQPGPTNVENRVLTRSLKPPSLGDIRMARLEGVPFQSKTLSGAADAAPCQNSAHSLR